MAGKDKRTTSLEGSLFVVVGDGWRERAIDEPRRLVIVVVGDGWRERANDKPRRLVVVII
jgi:hypothetical protein